MKKLFFWNRWNEEHRILYLFFLSLFTLSIGAFAISYFIGIHAVIQWEITSVMEPFLVIVDKFTRNLFDYGVEVESYVLRETYGASQVKVNLLSSYIFLAFLLPAIICSIVITTFLDKVAYFIGSALLMLLVVTLNLDLLNLFGYQNKIPAVALILLLGSLSYYFKAFQPETNFTKRFLAFTALFILCGIAIAFASRVEAPVLYLTNFGIAIPIVLTILFIFIIGFENINLFLYLAAGGNNAADNKSRLVNFLVISLLYLSNLVLMLMKKMLLIDWDILYINAFFLYFISSIIGIWGYKKRSVVFKEMLRFNPLGGLFYLALGIIANATIAYAFITGNDPLSECFEYAIMYAHVCFGLVYFIYILINYQPLFKQNISIYEIVYKPLNMPFFMVRGIGAAMVISIFVYSSNFALYLGMAGYYNLAGDVYNFEKNYALAKQYYLSGVRYEKQNHRSNYSLANMYEVEDNRDGQADYYNGSLVKRPFEYSYVNMSNLYLRENAYFQALFIAQEGLEKFPESAQLANNLAVIYMRTEIIDSIFYYLNKSMQNNKEEAVPATNYLYAVLKKNLPSYADTVLNYQNFPDNLSFQNNKLLFRNNLQQMDSLAKPVKIPNDSLLPVSFAYMYNQSLNVLRRNRKSISLKSLDALLAKPSNEPFKDALQLLKIMKLYYSGEKKTAFTELENLKNISSNAYFNKISGIWMLEQEAYIPAANEFFKTINSGGAPALLNYCMALCESGKFKEAAPSLEELKKSTDSAISELAAELLDIIQMPYSPEIHEWTEVKKLRFLHLRKQQLAFTQILELLNTFGSENFKTMSYAEAIEASIQKNELPSAQKLLENTAPDFKGKTYADGMLNLAWLNFMTASASWDILNQHVSDIYLNHESENLRDYFRAKTAAGKKNFKSAASLFESSFRKAPFFEKGIIDGAIIYNQINKSNRAYDILAEAVLFNPESTELLKAFALQALRSNLESYGDDAVKKLQYMLPQDEFTKFNSEYEAKKSKSADAL